MSPTFASPLLSNPKLGPSVTPDVLAPEWDELAVRVGAPPFMRPGWIRAWWHAFGKGELNVRPLRRDGELVAVLPFVRRGDCVLSPTNWHTPIYAPVAADADAARALLASVLTERPRRLAMSFLDPDLPGLTQLRKLVRGHRFSERVLIRSPYVLLRGDWERYFASLGGKHRQGIRRTGRRLEEMGQVTFEVVDGSEGLREPLEECFRVEASGWKGERGTAMTSSERTRRFYEEVAAWASRAGILRLAFLRLDGRAIAVNLSLEDRRSHYLLKTGYDPELRSLGPGRLLTAQMIRRSFELRHQTYEFLGGLAPYKLCWTETTRDLVEAQVFAPTAGGRLDHALHTRALPMARQLRSRLSG